MSVRFVLLSSYIYTVFLQDGGCTCPGDVAKAFGQSHLSLTILIASTPPSLPLPPSFSTGAGADFVMLGGMFAGHDQSGGETIEHDGKKYKLFYGMSSSTAMHKYSGGVKDYRWVTSFVTRHCINSQHSV